MSVPVAWVVALMVTLEPNAPWRPTFQRTAEAIARVAESEPLFESRGPERTAALLVALAWYESRLKPTAKSKNGRWVCLYQIDKRHLRDPQAALRDPEVCTRAAVKILRASLAKCVKRKPSERLAFFVSGRCDHGGKQSRQRTYLAKKLLREHPLAASPDAGAPLRDAKREDAKRDSDAKHEAAREDERAARAP